MEDELNWPRSKDWRPFGKTSGLSSRPAPRIRDISHALDNTSMSESLAMFVSPESPAAAAYRIARHQLFARRTAQVIAVSSPTPVSGKSAASANFALAVVESCIRRVLLVDVDVTHPALAELFGIEDEHDLVEQMALHSRDIERSWTVSRIAGTRLDVMTMARREGAHRLDPVMLKTFVDTFRGAEYDYIILDCPAVAQSAEINVIESVSDAVILCMDRRKSRARDLQDAAEQLTEDKLAGTIVLS